MHPERIQRLNDRESPSGRYVLYWMQQSQRALFNPALELAVGAANKHGLPLVVGFGLTDAYPDANARHYAFMLQGLAETRAALEARGIAFVLRLGSPDAVALDLAREAAGVICDRGYLRHQVAWRRRVAGEARCPVVEVEGDVVVPVAAASDRAESAARTIRPKINRRREEFLEEVGERPLDHAADGLELDSDLDVADPGAALARLDVDRSVPPVERFTGGTSEARARLERFIRGHLQGYAEIRNDPARPACSELSPYLHFGQVSPVEIVLKVQRAKAGSAEDKAKFLEELVVRRELACNFVAFTDAYDSFDCLPDWARKTLAGHEADPREPVYDRATLMACETHDRWWNAAMREMVATGYMHNYMRMYWGKKILEWSATPRGGYETTLWLNNRFFLDGRDPNSYASVAWIYGLHDRPWPERPVFGKTRYMNASGLKRKFDIETYARWCEGLEMPGSV